MKIYFHLFHYESKELVAKFPYEYDETLEIENLQKGCTLVLAQDGEDSFYDVLWVGRDEDDELHCAIAPTVEVLQHETYVH